MGKKTEFKINGKRLSNLKIAELRKECESRSISTEGTKQELFDRIKLNETEKLSEEIKDSPTVETSVNDNGLDEPEKELPSQVETCSEEVDVKEKDAEIEEHSIQESVPDPDEPCTAEKNNLNCEEKIIFNDADNGPIEKNIVVPATDTCPSYDIKVITPQNKSSKPPVIKRPGVSADKKDDAPTGENKRKWGLPKSDKNEKKPQISISTDVLKDIIPEIKEATTVEDLVHEEGQLSDDDDNEIVPSLNVTDDAVQQITNEQGDSDEIKTHISEGEPGEIEEDETKDEEVAASPSKSKHAKIHFNDSKVDASKLKQLRVNRGLVYVEEPLKRRKDLSPAKRSPSEILHITNLTRPFTISQLQSLLLRHGDLCSDEFWMDDIKSQCYVKFLNQDEAAACRNELHGCRWPPSNDKRLRVEFSTQRLLNSIRGVKTEDEERSEKLAKKKRVRRFSSSDDERVKITRPMSPPAELCRRESKEFPDMHSDDDRRRDSRLSERRKRQLVEDAKRRELQAKRRAEAKRRADDEMRIQEEMRRREEEQPVKMLDDLFCKTKSEPCIYWLPLTEEQMIERDKIRAKHPPPIIRDEPRLSPPIFRNERRSPHYYRRQYSPPHRRRSSPYYSRRR